jgi:hypothetical protein
LQLLSTYVRQTTDIEASFISGTMTDLSCVVYITASCSKADMMASIWRLPERVDLSVSDDNLANVPPLELVTSLEAPDYGDMKR